MRSRLLTLGAVSSLLAACAQAPVLTAAAGDDVTMRATIAAPQRHTLAAVPVNSASTIDHTDALLYSVVNGSESLYAQASLAGDPTGKVISFAHLHHDASYRLQLRSYSDPAGNDQISVDASSTTSFSTTTADAVSVGATPLVLTNVDFDATGTSNGISIVDGAFKQLGVVTTLAGNGSPGHDNGVGSAATFFSPHGIAVAPTGEVYVGDTFNRGIRKVLPDGTASDFYYPSGIAPEGIVVAPNGHVYAAIPNQDIIIELDASGTLVKTIGLFVHDAGNNPIGDHVDGPAATARFNNPTHIALDSAGNLYVSEVDNWDIRKVTPDGTVSTLVGGGGSAQIDGPAGTAQFLAPRGIAVDKAGNLYVCDGDNGGDLRKVAPDGTVSTFTPQTITLADGSSFGFTTPRGIAIDAHGDVYVTDQGQLVLLKFPAHGAPYIMAGKGGVSALGDDTSADGGANATFGLPVDVAVSSTGVLYIADWTGNAVRRIL